MRSGRLSGMTRLLGTLIILCTGMPAYLRSQTDTAGLKIRDSLDAAPWIEFRSAVVRSDTAAVAARIHFPLRVNGPGRVVHLVMDSVQFLREYGRILPPRLRALIARLPAESLWTSWRGTATPAGELWFEGDLLVAISLSSRP